MQLSLVFSFRIPWIFSRRKREPETRRADIPHWFWRAGELDLTKDSLVGPPSQKPERSMPSDRGVYHPP